MINFLQSNHELFNNAYMNSIITESLWEDIIENIKTMTTIGDIVTLIKQNAKEYNLEDKDLIIAFISYLTENKGYAQTKNWLCVFKFIIHILRNLL